MLLDRERYYKVIGKGLWSDDREEFDILTSRKYRRIVGECVDEEADFKFKTGGNAVEVKFRSPQKAEQGAHLLRDFKDRKIDVEGK